MSQEPMDPNRMRRAYRTGGNAYREHLRLHSPEEDAELGRIEPAEVVVVRGQYDRIPAVLEAASLPHLTVHPHELVRCDWARMQVLMVDCPGHLPDSALEKLGPWVRQGGYLVTTDWALKHVLEPVFPGRVRHNGRQTCDCVVRIEGEPASSDDPVLAGILQPGREPLWWLEGASYPIDILDTERVRVLARSKEVETRWGSGAIAVTFDEGEGTVLHLVSHLYLQRSDVRSTRDAQPALDYLASEMGLSENAVAALASEAEGLNRAEIEGAWSTSRLASRVILESRRRRTAAGGSR